MMFKKYFTPKEANRRLPLVRKIVAEILADGKALRKLFEDDKAPDLSSRCQEIEDRMVSLMRELEALGCYYKDWNFEIGLVDFPARVDGEEALLCWRSDEPEVLWYHGLDDGYAGRKPVPEQWLFGDQLGGEKA
ncbi:MAG: DUF2203 domain-containing protein [Candidatus Omnitrophota bacterium]|nr:DUF2203 domain-containing protein [Candidatus Omnitrophota bacterium]MDZ4242065.1 DUF2203 domain-containing protein [Candidatus Omnitrophota bacterium]